MQDLTFWYEFASPYSYVCAMRIEALAKERGVVVKWQPLLLGPIFKSKGWSSSPFVLDKVKGDYMWADVARLCAWYDLPKLTKPAPFPQHSLMATRVALSITDMKQRADFSKLVFQQEFGAQMDISSIDNIREWLGRVGLNADAVMQQAQTDQVKSQLRANVTAAMDLGIFGAPSFVARGELFWGNDRLEQAIARLAPKSS